MHRIPVVGTLAGGRRAPSPVARAPVVMRPSHRKPAFRFEGRTVSVSAHRGAKAELARTVNHTHFQLLVTVVGARVVSNSDQQWRLQGGTGKAVTWGE